MLQRSKRVLVTTVGSTPAEVGPGSYELPSANRLYETPWRLKGVPYGGLNRSDPRFHYIEHKMMHNDNPSAASYEITRFADRIDTSIPTASFASTTKRCVKKETDYPTACKYDMRSDLIETSKNQGGSPFLTSASRFPDHLIKRKSHLGPTTYNTENQSLAQNSMREACNRKTLKGAFGTNCSRKLKLINSYVALNMPGPESYRYDKADTRPLSLFGNSVFTSKTVRMGTNYKDKQNYPAPSEYSVHNYTISKDINRSDEPTNKPNVYHNRSTSYYRSQNTKNFPNIHGLGGIRSSPKISCSPVPTFTPKDRTNAFKLDSKTVKTMFTNNK